MNTLALLNFQPIDLLIVGLVGILLFGRRLPEIGKNLGKSIVELKKGLSSTHSEVDKALTEETTTSKPVISSTKQPVKQIAAGSDEP